MTPEEIYYQNRVNANLNAGEPKLASLADAYNIQKANMAKFGAVGAWKLGGSTATTQKVFATNSVYFGPILADDIFCAGDNIGFKAHIRPVKGEVEVCFRIAKSIGAGLVDKLSEDNIHEFIASVMPAIEFPWSPFPLPDAGLNVLVADRCASGALIVGRESPWRRDIPSQLDAEIRLASDGRELANGCVANIIGSPVAALISFANLAIQLGFTINAGDLVSTGGCTPCVEIPVGEVIRVEFSNFLGDFAFSLNQECR